MWGSPKLVITIKFKMTNLPFPILPCYVCSAFSNSAPLQGKVQWQPGPEELERMKKAYMFPDEERAKWALPPQEGKYQSIHILFVLFRQIK